MDISKTFGKFCLKNALVLSTLFALFMSFNADAHTGFFFNRKNHQNWSSGLFRFNNKTNARIAAVGISTTTTIVIDTDGDIYSVTLVDDKTQNDEIGKINCPSGVELGCLVRIDNKEPFNIGCKLSDDNTNWYLELYPGLGERFITESKLGSYLNVRINAIDNSDIRFSLRGFTAAINRALVLIEPNEKKYLKYEKNSSGRKKDSEYFL